MNLLSVSIQSSRMCRVMGRDQGSEQERSQYYESPQSAALIIGEWATEQETYLDET